MDDVLNEIEESLFTIAKAPGRHEPLGIAGLRGWSAPIAHPFGSVMGAATLTPETTDATIREVIDRFASRGLPFLWIVGPRSSPPDLGARLRAAGLTKADDWAGMALTELDRPIPASPAVHVREAGEGDREAALRVLARGFSLPEEVFRVFLEPLWRHPERVPSRSYLAFVDGVEEPVAAGHMLYSPARAVATLYTTATVPEHRGKGVYASLVARRVHDARRDGMRAVILQAMRTTSAPQCRKVGFAELCNLEIYVWSPPAASEN